MPVCVFADMHLNEEDVYLHKAILLHWIVWDNRNTTLMMCTGDDVHQTHYYISPC